eukprot:GCRY01000743.1.p1 GENE.GCRY01000743.1~~GCRY01000743.1.p1  ORF type:complete len:281 (+),score=59.24 GCRY01000743.1:172-1014(+)
MNKFKDRMGIHKDLVRAIEANAKVLETNRKVMTRQRAGLEALADFSRVEQTDLEQIFNTLSGIHSPYESEFQAFITRQEEYVEKLKEILANKKHVDKLRKDFDTADKKLQKAKDKLEKNSKPEKTAQLENEVTGANQARDAAEDAFNQGYEEFEDTASQSLKDALLYETEALVDFFRAGLSMAEEKLSFLQDAEVNAGGWQREARPAPQQVSAAADLEDGDEAVNFNVRGLYDYEPADETELAFFAGDVINVFIRHADGWLEGTLNGQSGLVPSSYVEEI